MNYGIDLSPTAYALRNINTAKAAIEASTEYERQIIEICIITGKTPDEIEEFYQKHDYSLEYTKEAVLAGCELSDYSGLISGIKIDAFEQLSEALQQFQKVRWDNMTLCEKVVDKLGDAIYYVGYYLAYPILWFTDWLWAGARSAYEDTWE